MGEERASVGEAAGGGEGAEAEQLAGEEFVAAEETGGEDLGVDLVELGHGGAGLEEGEALLFSREEDGVGVGNGSGGSVTVGPGGEEPSHAIGGTKTVRYKGQDKSFFMNDGELSAEGILQEKLLGQPFASCRVFTYDSDSVSVGKSQIPIP